MAKELLQERNAHNETKGSLQEERRNVLIAQEIINNLQSQIQELSRKLDDEVKTREQLQKASRVAQKELRDVKVQLEEDQRQLRRITLEREVVQKQWQQETVLVQQMKDQYESEYLQLRQQLEMDEKGREELKKSHTILQTEFDQMSSQLQQAKRREAELEMLYNSATTSLNNSDTRRERLELLNKQLDDEIRVLHQDMQEGTSNVIKDSQRKLMESLSTNEHLRQQKEEEIHKLKQEYENQRREEGKGNHANFKLMESSGR